VESHKVVHLTSVHPPFDTRIFHKECKTLAQAGLETVLIVPHDRVEVVDGVRIQAVPKPRNRRVRIMRTVWQVYRAAVRERARIYHFHDSELIGVGLLLKLRGKKVIYDVHEDLPRQILSKQWIPKWLRKGISLLAEAVEGLGALLFDRIVTVTEPIAGRFDARKTVVVKNFPIVEEMVVESPSPYAERPPSATYVAEGITVIRGLREMVQAQSLLPDELQAQLVFAGKISPPAMRENVQVLPGWEHVQEVGYLDRQGVRDLLGQVRIGLVAHHPIVNYLDSIPVKMFEYMAAGLPVIASNFTLWREFVEGNQCGICIDPLDPTAMAEAIRWLLEHPDQAEQMGENGRKAVLTRYNWQAEARHLLTAYGELLGDKLQVETV
jgi:glycosyltransferase involved in cell wall biosynthesis